MLNTLSSVQWSFLMVFPVHGYARATLDLDLFIRPTVENAKKVKAVLERFGYDVKDVTIEDLLENKVLIRQYWVETDIHPFVSGVDFNEVWANKVLQEVDGTPVYFAALEDLIKMKKAANRPKDREDLKILSEIKKKRRSFGKRK